LQQTQLILRGEFFDFFFENLHALEFQVDTAWCFKSLIFFSTLELNGLRLRLGAFPVKFVPTLPIRAGAASEENIYEVNYSSRRFWRCLCCWFAGSAMAEGKKYNWRVLGKFSSGER